MPVRAEVVVTDDAGRAVRLHAPARRIVGLAPHATELLFAAGAGARVVGVSAFSDYPQAARGLPQVSGGMRLDMERILALKPDLAVGWQTGNTRADLDRLAALGIPVFFAEPQRLDAVPETLLRLGHLAGSERAAESAAAAYRDELARLRARYRERRPVRVFFGISMQPLMTLNQAHLVSDLLALCGGRNVFAAYDLLAPEVSVEAVLLQDPDAILFSDELGTAEGVRDWWRERVSLRAVRAGRVYSVPASLVLRQTPRVLQGAQRVCDALDAARVSLAREPK
ncbi:MAG TPA: cobalamin-binding protein [Acidiferrobacterales bacterium]|nr:cobalamin-binding protein [Acidiferrobacterales bacterium]